MDENATINALVEALDAEDDGAAKTAAIKLIADALANLRRAADALEQIALNTQPNSGG